MSGQPTAPRTEGKRGRFGPPGTAAISARQARRSSVPPAWVAFAGRKLGHLLIVLVSVTFLVSLMIDLLPGDPARVILGTEATEAQLDIVREELHLDESVFVRYGLWVASAVQGDFGTSYRTGQDVGDAILQRMPVSLELMVLVQIIALVAAIGFAMFVTYRPNGWIDRASSVFSLVAISSPHFVIGLLLVFVFAVTLGVVPASGFSPLSEGLGANLVTVLVPAFALSLEPAGVYFRLLRGDMKATMNEDFVLAAQAKGMSSTNILLRQVFRPSSFSMVTLAGINTARLIGSAVVIETLFALPGLGRMLVDSVYSRDYVSIQAVVAVIAVFYVVVNILIDLLYLVLDPRVRSTRG